MAQAFENWIVFFFRGNFIKKSEFTCKKFVSYLQFILFIYFFYFLNYVSSKGPSTLATLFNHMWSRIVADPSTLGRHACYVCKRSVCGGDEPQPVAHLSHKLQCARQSLKIMVSYGNKYPRYNARPHVVEQSGQCARALNSGEGVPAVQIKKLNYQIIVFFFRGNFIKKYGFTCKKFVSYLHFIFFYYYFF